jgi:hypothetical protein
MVLKENVHPSIFQSDYLFLPYTESDIVKDETLKYESPNVGDLNRKSEPFKKKFSQELSVYDNKNDYEDLQSASGINEEKTPFKALFYNRSNVRNIQKMLKYSVFKKSGAYIGNQSETEILQIMRVIEKWYSYNPTKESTFVKEALKLNKLVAEYAVPRIITVLEGQKGFLRDFNNPDRKLLPLPISTTTVGGDNKLRDIRTVLDLS